MNDPTNEERRYDFAWGLIQLAVYLALAFAAVVAIEGAIK